MRIMVSVGPAAVVLWATLLVFGRTTQGQYRPGNQDPRANQHNRRRIQEDGVPDLVSQVAVEDAVINPDGNYVEDEWGDDILEDKNNAASSSSSRSSSSKSEMSEQPPPFDYRLFVMADKTHREGLGENLGFTAMEYLGCGYHAFLGNPR